MKYAGKYLAFTESGTKNDFGDTTGVDYLKELGITHVHLLPAFDYYTVDETRLAEEQFNWGYDPKNYNVPEGSYSTDPYHGEVRIKEFKQMVQALHRSGIRVIMDVVYNHTMEGESSNLNKIVPGYYYRLTPEGYFSNASGCGNETASERTMMRKFMIDSVVYWTKEYHIDGFRFDLMGIHDIQTMNEIRRVLNEVDPTVLVYGEGWTGGLSPLPDWKRAMKNNIKDMNYGIAAFSDNIRDTIKGNVFYQAPYGAAVYSTIAPEAEAQFVYDNNIYYKDEDEYLIRWDVKNYGKNDFAAYQAETGQDKHSCVKNVAFLNEESKDCKVK
jgi:pullulanase